MAQAGEFNAIRISLASPEQTRSWSYGEVTKPETINYRTLRPEKDGLFDERIFGPTKDWECYCGKYKKVRYKGVICDRCGVEVTRAKVRRERMGHIDLASPVAHIWFSRSTPSRLGLLLDLSPRNLERVLYFAQYVITKVDEKARHQAVELLETAHGQEIDQLDQEAQEQESRIRNPEVQEAPEENPSTPKDSDVEKDIAEIHRVLDENKARRNEEFQSNLDALEGLRPLQLLTDSRYRDLHSRFGDVFRASMGAEAMLDALRSLDLDALSEQLQQELHSHSIQRRKKAIKRLRVVEAFRNSGNKPEWMVLTVLPVLPPDLRPMVQLDGGRFATSDLNDLYRRVINRNNRLRRLLELGAPEIIVRNEKRMLQEAVDALIDNGRLGRAISGSHNHKLKSLSDLLRGKQGRFRQNLLGKRVDYSGRSVIVPGPNLLLHQCGLPKRMALELFKPFVMNRLVIQGLTHNIKSAKRMVESVHPAVWDILEDVIKDRPVLLNRAPTLHRLGIQAFLPVMVEGSAIQIHPLVCTAFNADFDGDQMAVHVPLSREAVQEALRIMLSTYNMLSPSSGDPIVAPTLDMVMGCYYLTSAKPGAHGEGGKYLGPDEVRMSHDHGYLDLRAEVKVRDSLERDGWIKTTPGRVIFNEVLPPQLRHYDRVIDKNGLKDIVSSCYRTLGNEGTATVLDKIKQLGFSYACVSGTTIAINDITVPPEKRNILEEASKQIEALEEQYEQGLITEEERYEAAVRTWQGVGEKMDDLIDKYLPTYGGVYLMATSGAKGNKAQVKQMAGMRGLMSNPRGEIIDIPIKSSFREGLTVLEYFISTHGARKGLADTALRTADAGYLTRRLIDVSQEVIVLEEDCGTQNGVWLIEEASEEDVMIAPFQERILGRITAAPIVDPKTGEVLVDANEEVDELKIDTVLKASVKAVYLRSSQTCDALRGVCATCYGRSPATGRLAMLGEAAGIIAAQSIGEPGTQLTMRTFHTGGVAGVDITSGLPRVEELFEARTPKGKAILSEIEGEVLVYRDGQIVGKSELASQEAAPSTDVTRAVRVVNLVPYSEEYVLPKGYSSTVEEKNWVEAGMPIAAPTRRKTSKADKEQSDPLSRLEIVSRMSGNVHLSKGKIEISWIERESREYRIPITASVLPKTGDQILAGQKITAGVKDPHEILRIEGREAVERYLVEQVQTVYRNQGVSINVKHIEVVARQMLRRVRVENPGDTGILPNQLIDRRALQELNAKTLTEGGEPATARPELLGVTRASLSTDSFLARASFQETARVLTDAAVKGETDYLRGLKENVIIGRLIPARFDLGEAGRRHLNLGDRKPGSFLTAGSARITFDNSRYETSEIDFPPEQPEVVETPPALAEA
jgi:DNA-directed RNA polymerase subunit beta'